MAEEGVNLFFKYMLIMLSISLFHQSVGMGHLRPRASCLKYSMKMLAMTGDMWEPTAAPWSCW